MKKIILNWLGMGILFDIVHSRIDKLTNLISLRIDIAELKSSLENRKIEIGSILEQLQNLDNNDVIMDLHDIIKDLHKRITELENAK